MDRTMASRAQKQTHAKEQEQEKEQEQDRIRRLQVLSEHLKGVPHPPPKEPQTCPHANVSSSTSSTSSTSSMSQDNQCPFLQSAQNGTSQPPAQTTSTEDSMVTAAVCGANEGEGVQVPKPEEVSALPTPPVAELQEGAMFPSFPQMKADADKLGTLFTYEIVGGRRMTVVNDDDLLEVVFSPHDMGMTPGVDDAVKVEMAKLAHAWFGIPRDIAEETNVSLLAVRRTLGPRSVVPLADKVGRGVKELFDNMGDSGEADLVSIAHGTFWPVNQAMFGESTIGPDVTPGADEWFHAFDEYIPQVTYGMPMSMFESMQQAATKIIQTFENAINKDLHLDSKNCPVLHARLAANDINKKYDKHKQAQFMISLFWAPQANTLPMTWWVLVHILSNPQVKAKVEKEVRETSPFKDAPDANGHFPVEEDELPYTRACMHEVLRMYVANLTHRKVARDIPLYCKGKWYKVPQNDMLTVASYLRHYDGTVFEDPHVFRPERWFEKKYKKEDYWPFALGRYSCSGKFLAMLEIPMLVGLFFRDFDTELVSKVPPADWSTVVASVRPEGWPYDTNCKVRFKRRNPVNKHSSAGAAPSSVRASSSSSS